MVNAFNTVDENITIVRGDTLAFGVELYTVDEENDALETLLNQDLDTCYFSVRKDYANTAYVLQKSLGNGIEKVETGKYRVRIAPEDTASLEAGNYYYDLEIGLNNDIFTVIKGSFIVEYDITRH